LGRIWKERIVGYLKKFISIYHTGLKKKTTEASARTTGFGPRMKHEESISPFVAFRTPDFMLLLIICIIHLSFAKRSYFRHVFLGRCMIHKVRRRQILEAV
jgi:hypothetical protein